MTSLQRSPAEATPRRGSRSGAAWALAWAAIALATSSLLAGSAHAADDSPRFARLSVDDGLAQNSVEDILQDRYGFLWFGTQEGLNRYDGYRFTVYRARPAAGFLSSNDVTALIEDVRGDLWVGTAGGLHRMDIETGRFQSIETSSEPPIETVDLVEDGAGRIWFGVASGGLFVVQADEDGPGEARAVESERLPAEVALDALAPRGAGGVWAAIGGVLLSVDLEGPEPRIDVALDGLGAISVLAVETSGHVWIGRPTGELLRYDPENGQAEGFPEAPQKVLALLPRGDGRLWIGARTGGLSQLDPESGEIVTHRHDPADLSSLSEDDVAGLYEDRFGTLWIGTWNGGVSRLDPYAQAFRTLRHAPGVTGSLPDDDVVAMIESPNGQLWLGSRNGVLAVGDAETGLFETVPLALLPVTRVSALAHSGRDIVVGTTQGLVRLDAQTRRRQPLSQGLRAARLDERRIEVLTTSGDALWIASAQTLVRQTPGSVDRNDLPLVGDISALFCPSEDSVWVGSEFGELLMGERESGAGPFDFRRVGGPEIERSLRGRGFITSIAQDHSGRFWVGTRNGLARLDPEGDSVEWLDREDGLPSQAVVGILVDGDGILWLGTNRGITRLDPDSRGFGARADFGSVEGAQGTGYADRAYTAGASGVFYFAGHGVTVFDPRDVLINPHPPEVVFTGLEILHRRMEPRWRDPDSPLEQAVYSTDTITLGPDASVFSVEFAALQYSDPDGNRYRYLLEGFDSDWIETDAGRRVATYTRLAPGDYVLRVRGGSKTGVWNPREATLTIHALPPWWRTGPAIAVWWALTVLGMLALWAEARRRTEYRIALVEREVLRQASLTDPLTGLSNRRFLDGYLQHDVPRVLRARDGERSTDEGPTDLMFVLIDLDHFKPINDRHSHAVGDQMLKSVADTLAGEIRGSDLAIRWGGDEFLVVSRFVDRRMAATTVERLRRAVEQVEVRTNAGETLRCTASGGYALFPFLESEPGALSWQRTLELADRALILTKARQRNSCAGLVAGPDLSLGAVERFLNGGADAVVPAGIEVVWAELADINNDDGTQQELGGGGPSSKPPEPPMREA